MYQKGFVLVLAAIIYSVNCELNIKTKCRIDDEKCLKESAIQFTPTFATDLEEYGIPPLDPLKIKFIDASIPNLSFKVSDVTVKGLKGCKSQKIKADTKKSKIYLQLLCDANLDGQYELNGKLLVINIEGHGKVQARIKQIFIDLEIDFVEKEKNGKKYWSMTAWKDTFQLKDQCDLEFENLFNGNEVLAKAANELIKTSSKEIIQEIGPVIINEIVKKIANSVNSLFRIKSLDELFVH